MFACMDMCIGMCIGMCTDMCTDMCVDMCVTMCVDTCADPRLDMCMDVCMDVCTDMCVDLCSVCLFQQAAQTRDRLVPHGIAQPVAPHRPRRQPERTCGRDTCVESVLQIGSI